MSCSQMGGLLHTGAMTRKSVAGYDLTGLMVDSEDTPYCHRRRQSQTGLAPPSPGDCGRDLSDAREGR